MTPAEILERIEELATARAHELMPGLADHVIAPMARGQCHLLAVGFLRGDLVDRLGFLSTESPLASETLQTVEQHREFAAALHDYMQRSYDETGEILGDRLLDIVSAEGTANDGARIFAIDGGCVIEPVLPPDDAGDPT